jgi:chromosome segregation protein
MKLRSLEIHGFKSFCDPITLSFPPGITTIVGPNGCGKSNILDAILWAIGEKSARHLRGKVMEDVIFAGADGMKPLGMAEVSLILANDDGGCPERYREFDEIMVSRRLFRSGESEYLINKTPCRLRDVIDLFLDLGMSNQAYSIVEQGKVDAIIHAKPEGRRIFIEEAAGIAKFRDRRREALSKMVLTEQNLLRIQDVIGEIRRQIQSLEKQVKKAERFKHLRKEIRSVELALAHTEYCRLSEQQAENETRLAHLKGDEASFSARLQERETKVKALRTECSTWEEQIGATERTLYEIRGIIDRENGRNEALNRELSGLKDLEVQYGEEIDELNTKLQAAKNRRSALHEESHSLAQRIVEKERELEAKGTQWQALCERWNEATHLLEDRKADLVEVLSKQSERRNQITFCERSLRELRGRKDRNNQEIQETKNTAEKNRRAIVEKEATRESLKSKHRQIDEAAEVLEREIASLEGKLAQVESRMRRVDHQFQVAWSTRQSLEELQKSFEGFDEGVKTIMLWRGSDLTRIHGLVADIFETEPPYEAAVSAVLAHRLQYLVVQTHREALAAIDLLRRQGRGRIGLIPMDLKREEHPSPPPPDGCGGLMGPLLQYVKWKRGYEHLGAFFLGHTWLVESLDQAIRVWQNGGGSLQSLVTLDGEVIDASGIIIGGSRDGQAFQILERKNKIRSLAEEVARTQSERSAIREEYQELRQRLVEARSRLDYKEREKQALALEQVATERDIERLIREVSDHERRYEVLIFEQEQLGSQIREGEKESLEAGLALENLDKDLQQKREAIETARVTLEASEKHKTLMDTEMTRVQVEIAGWREQRNGVQRNLDSLEEQGKDLRGQISKRLDLLEKNRRAIQKTGQDIIEVHASTKEWKMKQEEAGARLAREKHGLRERTRELRDLEDLNRRDQIRLEELRKRIHEENLRLAETHLTMNHVVENILDRYRIDLRVSPLPEEILTGGASDQDRLARLKMSLDSLGEVNLVALEEYEDLRERADFLIGQQDDLKASLNRLRKAIQRIDRTTRKRFLEAFEGTNQTFQALFPRLFNGGKAALVLTDEDDILNTGIEILAQLPGKRLQRLDLLSGGEKALVAIALIFAFFLYRPTPFCLLDEVDAPLDDSNVAKFLEMIQELSDQSQLILITHNKRTMEASHTLYGVTMESPGVSKVVSVKLNEPKSPPSPVSEKPAELSANF